MENFVLYSFWNTNYVTSLIFHGSIFLLYSHYIHHTKYTQKVDKLMICVMIESETDMAIHKRADMIIHKCTNA